MFPLLGQHVDEDVDLIAQYEVGVLVSLHILAVEEFQVV